MTPFHRDGSATSSHGLLPTFLSALLAMIGAATFFAATTTATTTAGAASANPHTPSTYSETRTSGSDADGTAAAEFDAAYPNCPTDFNGSRSVVLATDSNYPDALSASYLAGQLHTGILQTPTNDLSGQAAASMRIERVETVKVVGGPNAISAGVITELQETAAYLCHATFPAGHNLNVVVVAGPTEYDTSSDIAQCTPASTVGTAAFPNAYGSYDDTNGVSSLTGPQTAVRTAIVATGAGFQDATAASVIGDAEHFPVLLTTPTTLSTQAQTALLSLGIGQVILVGGPFALSDTVASQIEGLGISVLRIAGQDYTDTAQELANFELATAPGAGLGWGAANQNQITLARGDFYSDALAGAAFAANIAGPGAPQPILLTLDPNTVGPYLAAFLAASSASVFTVNILGGTLAITPATASAVLSDLSSG